jgi:hypothetical protein
MLCDLDGTFVELQLLSIKWTIWGMRFIDRDKPRNHFPRLDVDLLSKVPMWLALLLLDDFPIYLCEGMLGDYFRYISTARYLLRT